jgi:zinc transport system permease protein
MSALLLALAIGSVGLMGAFSLVFLPPWIAFQYASGWKSCLIISLCIGVASYLLSFILALHFDQPFGPVLVAVLLVVSLGCMAHIAIKRH